MTQAVRSSRTAFSGRFASTAVEYVTLSFEPNVALRASVRRHEWHLCFRKAFEDLTFDFFPRPRQSDIALRFSFRHPGLKSVRSICDSVDSDSPEHVLIEGFSVTKTAVRLVGDQGLKSFKDLKRRLEADGSRWDSISAGRLSHESRAESGLSSAFRREQ